MKNEKQRNCLLKKEGAYQLIVQQDNSRLHLLGSSGAIVRFVSVGRLGVKNANHQHDVEDEANAHAAHKCREVRHVGFPDSRALYTDQMKEVVQEKDINSACRGNTPAYVLRLFLAPAMPFTRIDSLSCDVLPSRGRCGRILRSLSRSLGRKWTSEADKCALGPTIASPSARKRRGKSSAHTHSHSGLVRYSSPRNSYPLGSNSILACVHGSLEADRVGRWGFSVAPHDARVGASRETQRH